MVWDIRPRIPTVRSMSSLPMAGLAYAVGAKSKKHFTSSSSATTPPPEYDNASDGEGTAPQNTQVIVSGPVPQDLERALEFQRTKARALERARYAAQGSLLMHSSQEAQVTARSAEEIQFARELYMTSLDYLLRGVPTDLSDVEKASLMQSVNQLYTRVGVTDGDRLEPRDSRPEIARTQQVIVQLCRGTAILIKISIPRIRQGLETAMELERQYHILQRSGNLVSDSLLTVADRASKTSFILPDLSRFSGLANGVISGVAIGVSEGYRILADQPAVI